MVRHRQDAEDLTQESLVRLCGAWGIGIAGGPSCLVDDHRWKPLPNALGAPDDAARDDALDRRIARHGSRSRAGTAVGRGVALGFGRRAERIPLGISAVFINSRMSYAEIADRLHRPAGNGEERGSTVPGMRLFSGYPSAASWAEVRDELRLV